MRGEQKTSEDGQVYKGTTGKYMISQKKCLQVEQRESFRDVKDL